MLKLLHVSHGRRKQSRDFSSLFSRSLGVSSLLLFAARLFYAAAATVQPRLFENGTDTASDRWGCCSTRKEWNEETSSHRDYYLPSPGKCRAERSPCGWKPRPTRGSCDYSGQNHHQVTARRSRRNHPQVGATYGKQLSRQPIHSPSNGTQSWGEVKEKS